MSSCFATPMSSLTLGCLHGVLSILELPGETNSSCYSCRQSYSDNHWSRWDCGGLTRQMIKDADKLHLLKITEISNPCYQRRVRCEKISWDLHRGFNPLYELRRVALFKKGAWKLRLEEESVNLGRGCQYTWVKLTAPPRKHQWLYSGRNWGGQRSPGGAGKETPAACKARRGREQGSTWSLFTAFLRSSALCSIWLWAVMVFIAFQRWHFFCVTLFTLGVGGGDPLIILTDRRSRKSSFKLLLWLKKHAKLLPLDIIKSTCSVLVYA